MNQAMNNYHLSYQSELQIIDIQAQYPSFILKFTFNQSHQPQALQPQLIFELMDNKQVQFYCDEVNLQMVIVFVIGRDRRFIYVSIIEQGNQKDIELCIEELQKLGQEEERSYNEELKKLQEERKRLQSLYLQLKVQSNTLNLKSDEYERSISMMAEECHKLHKNIFIADEDIMNYKKGEDLQHYRMETQDEKREERKKMVHFNELRKLNNVQVNTIMGEAVVRKNIALQGCQLKSMKFIEIFKNLREINLKKNLIRKMESLSGLMDLSFIELGCNRIQKIEGLDRNTELKYLGLQFNKITKIQNIFHLIKLEVLSLSQNSIEEIPRRIESLQSLTQLRLINNRVNVLAPQITNIRCLRVLSILGNVCFNDRHKQRDLLYELYNGGVYLSCGDF